MDYQNALHIVFKWIFDFLFFHLNVACSAVVYSAGVEWCSITQFKVKTLMNCSSNLLLIVGLLIRKSHQWMREMLICIWERVHGWKMYKFPFWSKMIFNRFKWSYVEWLILYSMHKLQRCVKKEKNCVPTLVFPYH